MTLEEQLARIAEVHNLTSLSINLYRRADGSFWIGSYAHADGGCGSCDNSATTVTDAITSAIANLNSERFPPAGPELDALAPMADVAETG
jgi:hypothetical protein